MRKLDLACGANCADGFDGVDICRVNDKVKHVVNLSAYPWPFDSGSVDEIRSSHYLEHIPMGFHTPPGSLRTDGHYTKPEDSDGWSWEDTITLVQVSDQSVELALKFFDECHRILKPGGTLHVFCPHGHSDRAFQDWSHRRFIVAASWDYLDADWRKANGLEHAAYGITCHFPIAQRKTGAVGSDEQVKVLSLMADSVQDAAVNRYWNMLSDFDVTLVKASVATPKTHEATPVAVTEVAAR